MLVKGFQAIDLVMFQLSNAIQIAKNSTEFYTEDFKNVIVVVATINYGEPQSFAICSVKRVSPKKRDVTLDNGLKYSKDGYEYGRASFSRIHHRVFVDGEETRKMAKSYMEQRNIVRKIMGQIREINVRLMMKSTVDNCRKLSLALDEILEKGE